MASQTENTEIDFSPPAPEGAMQRITGVMASIGTILIFATMVMIVADVLGRNFLNSPITGVAEIAGRLVVAIVFLQIASAIASDRMTRADFLIRIIGDRAPAFAAFLEKLFALCGAVVFALIAYASWPDLVSSWTTNDFFGVQGIFTIPTWPFRAIVVVGAVAAAIAYLLSIAGVGRPPAQTPAQTLD
ncbi:TRAP transporter small permease subunit [Arenibaculum pallidiluteum]|uniref:TRAP transporter small permease subunit n=1 Tax=Arenibaculum pallidiluteum TaxID=2812559 RepID=UPI001A95F7A6|nr:TRAP transporter small permease [Arenibaculum pallidiluteum]